MTQAVCFHCGDIKFGSFCPCPKCNKQPITDDELIHSLAMSDHYFDVPTLRQLGESVKKGEKINLAPENKAELQVILNEVRPSEKMKKKDNVKHNTSYPSMLFTMMLIVANIYVGFSFLENKQYLIGGVFVAVAFFISFYQYYRYFIAPTIAKKKQIITVLQDANFEECKKYEQTSPVAKMCCGFKSFSESKPNIMEMYTKENNHYNAYFIHYILSNLHQGLFLLIEAHTTEKDNSSIQQNHEKIVELASICINTDHLKVEVSNHLLGIMFPKEFDADEHSVSRLLLSVENTMLMFADYQKNAT